MQHKGGEDKVFVERVVFILMTLYFVGIITAGLWEIISDFL
jgi:hypothetical protein